MGTKGKCPKQGISSLTNTTEKQREGGSVSAQVCTHQHPQLGEDVPHVAVGRRTGGGGMGRRGEGDGLA